MPNSKKCELNKEDYKAIIRQIAIIYSPVILTGLEQIQAGEFDIKILYALLVSVTIDTIRRYFKDYTNNKT